MFVADQGRTLELAGVGASADHVAGDRRHRQPLPRRRRRRAGAGGRLRHGAHAGRAPVEPSCRAEGRRTDRAGAPRWSSEPTGGYIGRPGRKPRLATARDTKEATWPTPSPSPTIAPARPSPFLSPTASFRRRRFVSSTPTCSSTTRRTCRLRPASRRSPTSTATPASCATAATRSSSWRSSRRTSRSPICCSTASCPNKAELEQWTFDVTHHTFIHENMRKRFVDGFHYDAHPMGMFVAAVAALGTFYNDSKEIHDEESRRKQILRLIAKTPTIAAMCHRFSVGLPFNYPNNGLSYPGNFLQMMWSIGDDYELDPVLERAMDVLFILHADHEQNCGTTAMRVVGSSQADPYSSAAAAAAPCTARCTAAPTRPSCGCWRRSVRSTTSRPSSTRSRAAPTADGLRASRRTRTTTRGRRSSSRPPTTCSR